MKLLNKMGYDPVDDDTETGLQRPPRDAACVCDYFAELGYIHDEGKFMHAEMRLLLEDPASFFDLGR